MIIDFHTHIFPDNIAARTVEALSTKSGDVTNEYDGTRSGLLQCMDECGVNASVILPIATKPSQNRNVNQFAASCQSGRIVPFGSVHPDSEDLMETLESIKAMGMKGVKLHPDYQEFFVDDRKHFDMYKKIEELGLILVFHAGVDIGLPEPVHAPPAAVTAVARLFPKLTVVAAHFGGFLMWDEVLAQPSLDNLYYDTSYAFEITSDVMFRIIRAKGYEHILFASDGPWCSPDYVAERILSLPLPGDALDKIFYQNAQRLLDVEVIAADDTAE